MKKKVMKIVGLALALVMLAGVAACGDKEVKTESGTTESGTTESGPIEITYAMWGDADELATLNRVIEKYHSEQDRIRVKPLQIDRGEYEAWMTTQAIAQTLPDSAIMAEGQVMSWAEQGMLLPAGDMFAGFEEAPLDTLAFRFGGEVVGYSVANEILLNFYNRDMFAAAGIDVPPARLSNAWSWDQFIDVAKTMTLDSSGRNAHDAGFDRNNIVQYGVTFEPAPWMLEAFVLANNGGFYAPGNPNSVIIDQPAAIEAIQRIADLHLVHGVSPQWGSTTGTIETHLMQSTAMYINGQWSVGVWLGGAKQNNGLNYGIGVLPSMARNATIGTGGVNVVFKTSSNQDAAKEWLAWYAQLENSWNLIEAGIWMPIFPSWYTDEAKMRSWADNPNFPPFEEYKTAVIEYAMSPAAHPTAWYWVNNTDQFNDILSTALAPVWSGQSTAADAINGAMAALSAANRGN